ncbi:hypothetical protein H0W80_00390 [Candidatus Saccharibacteria bacterium]|nr:hypothetical protein [Candidatus Saccharibacteria bacterium]
MNDINQVAQKALDIYRGICKEQGKNEIYVFFASRPLSDRGMRHYDAERAYAHLKRLGLVTSLKCESGKKYYHLHIEPNKSVLERIAEMRSIKQSQSIQEQDPTREQFLHDQITLHYIEIARIQAELDQLEYKKNYPVLTSPT